MTSKEAFEFIFGQYGINDAGYKIWEAAINWERQTTIDTLKRYKARNKDSPLRKDVAEYMIANIRKKINQDKGEGNAV